MTLNVPIDTTTSVVVASPFEFINDPGRIQFVGVGTLQQKRKSAVLEDDGSIDFGVGPLLGLAGNLEASRFDTTTEGGIEMKGTGLTFGEYVPTDGGGFDYEHVGSGDLSFSAKRCTALDD